MGYLEKIKTKIKKKRLHAADRLMRLFLDYRIDNVFITKKLFWVYQRLIKDVYIFDYKKENNHYIPQFLLRQFKIPNTGNIYEYAVDSVAKPKSIEKEAALVPDLYTTTDKATKQKSNFIEKQLFAFTLEKYASRIISQMQKSPELNFTNMERSIITSFVAFQYTRTPGFFALVSTVIEYLSLEMKVPLEEIAHEDFCQKALFDNHYNLTRKKVVSFGLKNDLKLSGAENLVLKISIQAGNTLSEMIYKKSIRSVEVKSPGFFYLTDNPVGIINTDTGKSVGTLFWEINEKSLVYLPISPTQCLYFIDDASEIGFGPTGAIISRCLKRDIFQFAYSDRDVGNIVNLF